MKAVCFGSLSLSMALFASGCSVHAEAAAPPPDGAAIMDWTVAESKDPSSCGAFGAATFHVSLYDSAGAFAGEYVQDCAAMATTVDGLAPDTYSGHAELLDATGNARTTSVDLAPFDVVGNASVSVALDFPADSFH